MVNEGLIDIDEAIGRIDPRASSWSCVRCSIPMPRRRSSLAASTRAGAATGRVVFHSDEAQSSQSAARRHSGSDGDQPEDIQGMTVSTGILTSRGGQTSRRCRGARHGSSLRRGLLEIAVDYARALFYAGDTVIRRGDWITIDGGTGEVMEGQVPTIAPPTDAGAMALLLGWADERARLEVRANADNGPDATRARSLGAVGIGLCRTGTCSSNRMHSARCDR